MARLIKIMVLFFVLTIPCSAQTFNTPEVSSIKQEVFRPFSYYTGQANISIPLTQIQTSEITVPVTLNYVGGTGLQPINPYSSMGMGWRLSAGGAITRTKNNVCDESISTAGNNPKGFFSLPPNTVNNSDVRNNVSSYYTEQPIVGLAFSKDIEYSPDVFSFSFLGYSGYFIMGYDGQFKIQSQDIASVEKFSASNWPSGQATVMFKLTANDGTVFTFGSTYGSIEFSGGSNGAAYQADAWYLTKIESVNSRIISFNYQDNAQTSVRFKPSMDAVQSTISPVVLDNIVFNGGKVIFTSSSVTQKIVDSPSNVRRIDKIELKDSDNQVVSSADFSYVSKQLERYYFLNSLVINGKSYVFQYNDLESLPNINQSFGTDYWGFYNSKNEVQASAVTSTFWDNYLNPTVNYEPRNPSLTSTKIGVLTSITYPTGGLENYEYELNSYFTVGKQGIGGRYYQSLQSGVSQTAGGLRVSKITLGDVVRKYKYVQDFNPNNPDFTSGSSPLQFLSSGILYRLPGVPHFGTTVLNALSIDGEPAVVYYKVIEYLSDKSYTEYNLRSPLEYPDQDNSQNNAYYRTSFDKPGITNTFAVTGFVGNLGKSSSTSLERGQVSLMKVFDASNTLKKQIAYTYATAQDRFNQNVAVLNAVSSQIPGLLELSTQLGQSLPGNTNGFTIANSFQVYTYPVFLEKEIETSYEAGNEIKKTTEYVYNTQKLRSQIRFFIDSKGDTIKTKTRYPSDINTGIYSAMTSKKMLNFPIEQVQLKNNLVTGSGLNTYKTLSFTSNGTNTTYYVPDKKYTLGITAAFAESSFSNFNGTDKDSRYAVTPDISYDNQSDYGNVRQTTGRDGIKTSYLWDASSIYPMAQVKGAEYSSMAIQDGKAASYSSSALYTSLKDLAPSALITTYSYKPLYGIESVTNPAGKLTWYKYDNFARLSEVREGSSSGNLIKSFHYNYAGGGFTDEKVSDNPGAGTPQDVSLIVASGCDFTISVTANPVSPGAGQSVTFTANCSGGDCNALTYSWTGQGSNGTSSTTTFTTPSTAGNYNYSVTVNRSGCSSAKTANFVLTVPATGSLPFTNGCYTIRAKHSNKYLRPENNNSGARIRQYASSGQSDQIFQLEAVDANSYKIVSQSSGKVWNASGSGNNSAVNQADWNNTDSQKWILTAWGDGSYKLAPKNASGRIADVEDISVNDGAGLQLYDALTGDNQKFYISSVTCQTENCSATGYVVRKRWVNLGSSSNVSDLISGTNNFANTPSTTSNLTSLETETNWGDNYGQFIQGYITPAQSGSYIFWIASDDNSELWLSSTNNPANKVKIAWVSAYTDSRQWNKEGNQKSASITLAACTQYYFEVLHKEGAGGDNLAVGWSTPGQNTDAPSGVVPGSVLSPYGGSSCTAPSKPTINQPSGTTVCAASSQSVVLTANANVTWYKDGVQVGTLGSNSYTAVSPGVYTAKAFSGSCSSEVSNSITITQSSGCGSLPACDCGFNLLNAKQNSGQYTATFEFASCNVNAVNWSILSGSTVVASGTVTVTSSVVPFTVPSNVSSGSYTFKADVVNCSGSGTVAFNYTKPGENPSGCTGTGTGLRGKYFNSFDLTGSPVLTRIDATINFVLANNSPAPGTVNADFSARWEGQIEAPVSGTYTFKTNNDDGTRVWVNNVLVIDDWVGHGATVKTGTISLSACQKYDIKVEYFDSGEGAQAQLFWTYPGQGEQIVPQNRLYPATADVCTTPSAPSISSSSTTVCAASSQSVTLTATGSGTITWYKDGSQVGTSNTYSTSQAGVYTAKATNGTCVSTASNSVTLTQASNCSSTNSYTCQGYTFTDGQVLGSTSINVVVRIESGCPVAYWQGGNGNGRTNADWISQLQGKTIPDNILRSCVKWDGDALDCQTTCTTPSAPTISSPSTTVCAVSSQSVTLTATGSGTITWYKDGNQVGTGNTYSTSQAGVYTAKATNGTCVSTASNSVTLTQASNCGNTAACDCGFNLLNAKQNSGQYTATFEFASCNVNAVNWSILSGSTVVASGTVTVTSSVVPFTVPSNVSSGSYTFKADVVNCSGSGTVAFNYTKPGENPSGCTGTGTGLRGKYFNSFDLTGSPVLTRIDATINFVLANNSPAPGTVNADFSARWEGQIEAPVSGTYTFKTNNDDGTRVWVNNVLVIDDWIGHGATVKTGTISLSACQKYDIKVEYFDSGEGAQAQLFWTYPGQGEQIVPQNRLYPATADLCTAPSVPTINQPSSTTVCAVANLSVTLTTSSSATITWYKDGTSLGVTGSSYTTSTPGGYTARASDGTCVSGVSNSITLSQNSNCGSNCYTMSPASQPTKRLYNNNGVPKLRDSDGSNSQIWEKSDQGSGFFKIVAKGSTAGTGVGSVLGVAGQGSQVDNLVDLQGSTAGDHQLWDLSTLPGADASWRKIVRKGTILRIGSKYNWGAGEPTISSSDLSLADDQNNISGNNKWIMNPVGCPATTPVSCNFTASLSSTNNNPNLGQGVTLTAGCVGPDCNSLTYSWAGPGANGTANTTSFNAPNSSGLYTYTVTISKSGCSNPQSASVVLDVRNSTPSGCYTLAPASYPDKRLTNQDGVTNIRNADGSNSQIWQISAETGNQNGYSKIVAKGSTTGARIGMVLGVLFQGSSEGNVIELQTNIPPGTAGTYTPADHQLWDPLPIPFADISWRKFVRKGTTLRIGSRYNWGAGDASTDPGANINPVESDLALADDPDNVFGRNKWIITPAVCPNN